MFVWYYFKQIAFGYCFDLDEDRITFYEQFM